MARTKRGGAKTGAASAAGKRKKAEPAHDDGADELVKRKLARKHGDEPAFKAPEQPKPEPDVKDEADGDEEKPNFVEINRAPVLTAWVAAVAKREGYSREAALTFGKAIAGMFAQSKGRSIGVYEAAEEKTAEEREARRAADEEAGVQHVEVFGTHIKAVHAGGELRAAETNKKAIDPSKVQQYLQRAFKDRLGDVEDAMRQLAESFPKDKIGGEAYGLYESFRPTVPQGKQGWGRKGRLELDRLLELRQAPEAGGEPADAEAPAEEAAAEKTGDAAEGEDEEEAEES